MAETVERINILELEIDQEDALNETTRLSDEIKGLKNEIKDLDKENKDLEKQGKKNTQQYKDNAKQIEANKLQVGSLNKEYRAQQRVTNDLINTEQKEIGTLKQLAQRNKELREERNDLNLETEEGKSRLTEINSELDQNNAFIAENSDSLKQQKINIGNYQSALDNLPPGLQNTTSGIQNMIRAAKAFIATPLGIILAAVAGAVALMTKAFRGSQGLMDEVSVRAKGLGAAFDVVIDRVGDGMEKAFKRLREEPLQAVKDLGKGIVDNLVNRVEALPQIFIKAFEAVKHAIKGQGDEARASMEELRTAIIQVGTGLDEVQQENFAKKTRELTKEVRDETNAAKELQRQYIALAEAEIVLTTRKEELRREIERLKLETRDETLSIEQRLEAQQRAIDLEKTLLDEEIAVAKERARILEEQQALGKSTREDRQELAELQAEVIRLESSYYTRSKELASEYNSLQNQFQAQEEARIQQRIELRRQEVEALEASLDEQIELIDEEIALMIEKDEAEAKRAQEVQKQLNDLRLQELGNGFTAQEERLRLWYDKQVEMAGGNQEVLTQLEATYAKRRADLNDKVNQQRVDGIMATLQTAQGLFEENSLAYKATTTALIVADTMKAAMGAYASLAGIPLVGPGLGIVAAGAAIAAGGKAVKEVWKADPKSGSQSVSNIGGGSSASAGAGQSVPDAVTLDDGGLIGRDTGAQANENLKNTLVNALNEADQKNVLVIDQVKSDLKTQDRIENLATT